LVFNPGRGEDTFFWSDEWVGEATLKRRIDRLYSLSLCKEPSVSDMRKKVENSWVRDLNWSRELYGHNVGVVKGSYNFRNMIMLFNL